MVSGDGPFFVVGVPRSGTTLLRYMLCGHPNLYLPPESGFLPRFAAFDPHEPLGLVAAEGLVGSILSDDWFFKDWKGDRPTITALVDASRGASPAAVLDAIYRDYALQHGAKRWGDKTPAHTEHLELIDRLFPSARIIHVIRDGRDVALSLQQMRAERPARFFYVDVYYAARTWNHRIRRSRRVGARLGRDRYHEIRYEELVAEPARVLGDLCAFLGEAFDAGMLEPHQVAREHASSKGRHAATREPVNSKSVGRWRRQMCEEDRRLFESIAGDLLDELDYGRSTAGQMGGRQHLRRAGLTAKYATSQFGRWVLRESGVHHPTKLLGSMPLQVRPGRARG